MSARMPPYCARSKNHAGRDGAFRRCGPEADGLDHLADRARPDQLARPHGGRVLETLAEADRVDAPGLCLDPARLGQLPERRERRLVAHVVLAVAHRLDAERPALARDGGAHDQLDPRVLQDSRRLRARFVSGYRRRYSAARSAPPRRTRRAPAPARTRDPSERRLAVVHPDDANRPPDDLLRSRAPYDRARCVQCGGLRVAQRAWGPASFQAPGANELRAAQRDPHNRAWSGSSPTSALSPSCRWC